MGHVRLDCSTHQNGKELYFGRRFHRRLVGSPFCFTRRAGVVIGGARLDHRTYLIKTHLTLVGAGTARRLGRARLQHLLVHTKANTEDRPWQAGLLHMLACVRSRSGSRPGGRTWVTPCLAIAPTAGHMSQGWVLVRMGRTALLVSKCVGLLYNG